MMKRLSGIGLLIALFGMVISCGVPVNLINVSGSFTGAYSSLWKAAVGSKSGGTYFLNGVSSADGAGHFDITVQKNLGGKIVIAFIDLNNNNIPDAGETVSIDQPVVNIGADPVSGVVIDIPIIEIYSASGKLTNHFTPAWKVKMQTLTSLEYYTAPDAGGNFSVMAIPSMLTMTLKAFRDDNGNNILDPGEFTVPYAETFTLYTNHVSNIVINIPDFSSMTIGGELKGNIFGLPVGVVAYDNISGQTAYTAPSTNKNIPFSLGITVGNTNSIELSYYVDTTGNNAFDGILSEYTSECMGKLGTIYTVSNLSGLVFNLVPKLISGTLSGSGADDMKYVILFRGIDEFTYSPVAGSSYTLKLYTCASGSTNNESYFMFATVEQLSGAIGYFQFLINSIASSKTSVKNTNSLPFGNNYIRYTNTVNFPVSKYSFTGMIFGDDASLFKFGVLDNLEFPSYDMTFGSYPQNTVINVYSFNSAPVSAMIGVFKDEDNDNRVLYNELTLSASEPIYLKTKAISNSILLTNKFFMAKTVVNLSVNGNPAGYVNPKVIVSGSSIGIGSKGYAPVSQTITIHSELSNIGYQGIAFAFSDVNGDGYFSPFNDKIISTNMSIWGNAVSVTNITLYLTNHL